MRSIREPGAAPRELRMTPPAHADRPAPAAPVRAPRSRPDANPARLMLGLAGLATAAAFTTAMLPSVTPAPVPDPALEPVVAAVEQVQPDPSVKHVTQYVQLKAGQTAPPQSTVVVRPTPTPRVKVKVVTQTKQSGKP